MLWQQTVSRTVAIMRRQEEARWQLEKAQSVRCRMMELA